MKKFSARVLAALAAVCLFPALSQAGGPVRDWIRDHRPGLLFAKPETVAPAWRPGDLLKRIIGWPGHLIPWQAAPGQGCPCTQGQCPCKTAPGGKGTCGSFLCPANGGRPLPPSGVIVWPQQPTCPNCPGGFCPIPKR